EARGGRARVPLAALRAADRGADPHARRREALSLRHGPVISQPAVACVPPQPRAAGRPVLGRRRRGFRGVAVCEGCGAPAALGRRRQDRWPSDSGARALPRHPRIGAAGAARLALPPEALALALAAAVIHAGWNLLLAGARDTQ